MGPFLARSVLFMKRALVNKPRFAIDVPNAHRGTRINKIYQIARFHVSIVGELCKCRDRKIGVVRGPVRDRGCAWVLDEVCECGL